MNKTCLFIYFGHRAWIPLCENTLLFCCEIKKKSVPIFHTIIDSISEATSAVQYKLYKQVFALSNQEYLQIFLSTEPPNKPNNWPNNNDTEPVSLTL